MMKMRIGFVFLAIAGIVFFVFSPPSFATLTGKPIVIGYIGDVTSPGTRPNMEIQKFAVEEINKNGGILGRPVKFIIVDGKGGTSQTVEGARRLIIEDKADFITVEGRSEICLAAQENSAVLFKQYPHIMIFNGPMAPELTDRVVDDYDKFKFSFRDWDAASHYAWLETVFDQVVKSTIKATRIAILWEDLTWTEGWRKGLKLGDQTLPPWEEVAKEKYGLEVVYSKAVKPRGTMYLPILQQIAAKKAEVIFYVSSWFTDTETFTKQWHDSAARDLPIILYGGVSQTHGFWDMTGGKAAGVITPFFEGNIAYTEKTLPFIAKARMQGIPSQIHVHLAYADIYHIKAAIEWAEGTDDIDEIIRAMEEVQTTYSLGRMKYQVQRIKPFFHSRLMCDPRNPYKMLPGYFMLPVAQYQENGKIVWIAAPKVDKEIYDSYVDPAYYRSPAQLRK